MSDVVLNPSNSYRHASRPGEVRGRNRHLGKIIVVTLKGMMGSTLGSEIENT
jgi:hypothetical protein